LRHIKTNRAIVNLDIFPTLCLIIAEHGPFLMFTNCFGQDVITIDCINDSRDKSLTIGSAIIAESLIFVGHNVLIIALISRTMF